MACLPFRRSFDYNEFDRCKLAGYEQGMNHPFQDQQNAATAGGPQGLAIVRSKP
jgi:hypothetical protein